MVGLEPQELMDGTGGGIWLRVLGVHAGVQVAAQVPDSSSMVAEDLKCHARIHTWMRLLHLHCRTYKVDKKSIEKGVEICIFPSTLLATDFLVLNPARFR
ncbi:hypothetical protein Y1Q_0004656 [Alligator mississippiensis]|uniref:Uncharacterized protein n=1 Tax=Alligator mississippiensis TaxID=8496 RepID=A0A151MHS1_ALLMI|nr:hypothetical protein Y1Q_0004656 [Alligator mississippiensis]